MYAFYTFPKTVLDAIHFVPLDKTRKPKCIQTTLNIFSGVSNFLRSFYGRSYFAIIGISLEDEFMLEVEGVSKDIQYIGQLT